MKRILSSLVFCFSICLTFLFAGCGPITEFPSSDEVEAMIGNNYRFKVSNYEKENGELLTESISTYIVDGDNVYLKYQDLIDSSMNYEVLLYENNYYNKVGNEFMLAESVEKFYCLEDYLACLSGKSGSEIADEPVANIVCKKYEVNKQEFYWISDALICVLKYKYEGDRIERGWEVLEIEVGGQTLDILVEDNV